MANKIKVGDRIEIEQAWEDETGNYHDECADVLAIAKDGRMTLEFDRKDITEFLKTAGFYVEDYQDCII